MDWTEEKKPEDGVSYYDHTILVTPIGEFIIEWKSWKEHPSYDISIDGEWVGTEYDLESAKNKVTEYITDISNNLIKFLI